MTEPVPAWEALVGGLTADERLSLGHYLLSGEELTDLARTNKVLGRDPGDLEALESVEAVVSLVPTWKPRPANGWAAHHKWGATLLAARLERRKDSPGGLAQFGMEGGGFVTSNWPDVALLLGIGNYGVGRVG